MNTNKIYAAILSLAMLVPSAGAFATTRHHVRHYRTSYHRHHYSQTRGALVGAAAGALIDHRNAAKGALMGAAVGAGVQYERNHH